MAKLRASPELRGDDQEAEPDGEMRDHQRRQQHRLDAALEAELVAVEREGEGGADDQRDGRGPGGDDRSVAEAGLEVLVGQRLDEPAQRPGLGRERQDGAAVEGGQRDDDRRQHQETEDGDHGEDAGQAQQALGERARHQCGPMRSSGRAARRSRARVAKASARPATDRLAANGKLKLAKPSW